jgi:hypothetical protein
MRLAARGRKKLGQTIPRKDKMTIAGKGGDQAGVREWLETLALGQLAAEVISASATEKEGTPAVIS